MQGASQKPIGGGVDPSEAWGVDIVFLLAAERGDAEVSDGSTVTSDIGVATDKREGEEKALRALRGDASSSEIKEPNELHGDNRVGKGPDTGKVTTPTLIPN